jgi:two-component sensor histidine kinase
VLVSDDGVGLSTDMDWRNLETLGLSLVKNLVEEQLQGTVEMETGTGTLFRIRINTEARKDGK